MGLLDLERSANSYIPADFSTSMALSKRKKKKKRAIKLLHGASLGPEIIVDCQDLTMPTRPADAAMERHSDLMKRKTLEIDPLVAEADENDDVDMRTRVFNPIVGRRIDGSSSSSSFATRTLGLEDIVISGSINEVLYAMDREKEEADYDLPSGKEEKRLDHQ